MSEQPPVQTFNPARRVAYAGLVTALSVVLLYLLHVLPTMDLAILFVLSLLPVVLACEKRYLDAVLAYAAATVLTMLMLPVSLHWLMYAAFFGWYGIAREYAVHRWNRLIVWIVSVILFNVTFFLLFSLAGQFFDDTIWSLQNRFSLQKSAVILLLVLAAEAAFVVFELVFGMCRVYYIRHIRRLLYTRR